MGDTCVAERSEALGPGPASAVADRVRPSIGDGPHDLAPGPGPASVPCFSVTPSDIPTGIALGVTEYHHFDKRWIPTEKVGGRPGRPPAAGRGKRDVREKHDFSLHQVPFSRESLSV